MKNFLSVCKMSGYASDNQLVKNFRNLVLSVVLILMCGSVWAYNFEVDGIYYNVIDADNHYVEVTYSSTSYSTYSGDVVVPQTVVNPNDNLPYTVTAVGASAFRRGTTIFAQGVTSVTLPATVTTIGSYAFANNGTSGSNNYLPSIALPASVTSIDTYAFQGCSNLTTITLPAALTTIGNNAFQSCTGLATVSFPESLTSIGSSAFYGCSAITSVTIPANVTSLGSSAFSGCTGLTSVFFNATNLTSPGNVTVWGTPSNPCTLTIGANVTQIPDYVFKGLLGNVTTINFNSNVCIDYTSSTYNYLWPSLSSTCAVVFGDNVTHVPNYLFYTTKIGSVTFGNNLESIGEYAFAAQSSGPMYNTLNGATVTFPETLTTIGQYAFRYTKADFTGFPSSVTTIGQYAFNGCVNMTCSVDLTNVTEITSNVFNGCTSITSVTIGENATSIASGAFTDCTAITSVTFNAINMASPGNITIWGTPTNPCTLTIGPNVTQIPVYVFKGLNNVGVINFNAINCIDYTSSNYSNLWPTLASSCAVVFGNDVIHVPNYIFKGKSLASLTFGNSIQSIGEYAFENTVPMSSNLNGATVTLPSTLTTIGQYAFRYCKANFVWTSSITTIGTYAFQGCTNMTCDVDLSNLTAIPAYTFNNCSGIPSVTIGENVTTIGSNAFTGCTAITNVFFNAVNLTSPGSSNTIWGTPANPCTITVGPDVTTIPSYAFKGLDNVHAVVFNATECNDYTSSTISGVWPTLVTCDVTFGTGVIKVPDYLFYNKSAVASVSFANGITSIGQYAFRGCYAITEMVLPASLASIGQYAFQNCTGLTSINIPDGVTVISQYAFNGCSGITSLNIGDNVTTIETQAFSNCSGIITLTIGTGVTTFGTKAFANCTSLNTVNFNPVNVSSVPTSTSSYVFNSCSTTNPIILNIGTGVGVIPNYMFYGLEKIGTINYNATQCADHTSSDYTGIWSCKSTEGLSTVLNIGDNVKHIPAYLFRAFNNLTAINMGDEVESIGDYAFYVSSGSSRLEGTTITLPSTLSSVGQYAFYYCLADFEIPSTISTLGQYAFAYCSNLSCPVVLNSLTTVPAGAFSNCSSLRNLTIGPNVTTMESKPFYYCTGLDTINFNAIALSTLTTSMSGYPFSGCTTTNPVTLNIGEGVTYIRNYMFYSLTKIGTINFNATNCGDNSSTTSSTLYYANIWGSKSTEGVSTVLNIGDNVKHIPAYLFYGYNNLTAINAGSHLESIGDYAFYVTSGNSRLNGTITLPESLTTVGQYAFRYCNADFILPSTITTLGSYAFANCANFTHQVVLTSITSIPTYAFYYCSSLRSIIIGEDVTSIGNYAFAYCSGLDEIWAKPAEPVSINSYVFTSVPRTIPLYVPKGSLTAYKAASVWKTFLVTAYVTFVNDGEWDVTSNWLETELPDNETAAMIEADASIPSGLVAEAVAIAVDGGSITIEDGGQLIHGNAFVKATMKKYIVGMNGDEDEHWYTISSPVDEAVISQVENLLDETYDFYRYNEVAMCWENAKNTDEHPDFTYFENGRGYIYRNSNNVQLEFTGELNADAATYHATVTTNSYPGFHLVGNPFAHNIYKGEGTAIDDANLTTGFYHLANDGWWEARTDNSSPVTPCESILIQAYVEGDVEVTKKTTQSSAKANVEFIQFEVANNTYKDVAYAWFDDAVGLNKIEHRNALIPMLYVYKNDKSYAIATMNDDAKSLNLNFKAATAGRYTLKTKANGQFSYLHLIDRLTGNDVDLLIDGEYSFMGSPRDNENRFIVRLNPNSDDDFNSDVFAYQNGSEIIVMGTGELQVFDVTGKLVLTQHIEGAGTWNTPATQTTGVYILRLVGTEVKTQKIVVR